MTIISPPGTGNSVRTTHIEGLNQTPKTVLRQMAEFKEAIIQLRGKNVLLTTHIEVDGDGLCSMLAVTRVLEEFGVNPIMVHPEPFLTNLDFLASVSKFRIRRSVPARIKFNGAIILDTPIPANIDKKIGGFINKNIPASQVMEIDHHLGKGNLRVGKGPVIIDRASSAAELIYEFSQFCNLPLPWDMYLFCYIGMMSDTGNFEYLQREDSSIAKKTRRIADEIISKGSLKVSKIHELVASLTPFESALLDHAVGRHLSRLDGKIRYIVIDELSQGIPRKNIFEMMSDRLGNIEGTEIVVLFRKKGADAVKVSIRRYRSGIDVSLFASYYGGGGHPRAAGITIIDRSLEPVVSGVLDRLSAILKR